MDEKKKIDWPQWAVAFGTLLLAVATFWIVLQNSSNITLTRRITQNAESEAYMKWRPDIFMELVLEDNTNKKNNERKEGQTILQKAQAGELQDFTVVCAVKWGNAGGSPALSITRNPVVNKIKQPIADTMSFRSMVGFSLWPTQRQYDELQFTIDNHAPTDVLYLHIPTWYKDRKGNEYWFETVFCYRFEKGKLVRWNILDGVYEGIVRKEAQ